MKFYAFLLKINMLVLWCSFSCEMWLFVKIFSYFQKLRGRTQYYLLKGSLHFIHCFLLERETVNKYETKILS